MHHGDGADHIHYADYGTEIAIKGLAETIARVVGHEAKLVFDSSKPDGTPRKLMDSSRLHALGWFNVGSLEECIALTYEYWLALQT